MVSRFPGCWASTSPFAAPHKRNPARKRVSHLSSVAMMMPGPPGGALISVQEALGMGPEPPKPLTAEEAEEAATAENLTLVPSDKNASGFRGVREELSNERPAIPRVPFFRGMVISAPKGVGGMVNSVRESL